MRFRGVGTIIGWSPSPAPKLIETASEIAGKKVVSASLYALTLHIVEAVVVKMFPTTLHTDPMTLGKIVQNG